MRLVLALVLCAALVGSVSAASRSNGLREALVAGRLANKHTFAGANICTIVVCAADEEVTTASNVIPALVGAAGKNHIAVNGYLTGAPPGPAVVTAAMTNNAAAKARAKTAVAQILALATGSNCNEVNILGHGANNKVGYTFSGPDAKGGQSAFVSNDDIFTALSAVGTISKINFMVCLCAVPAHAKLGLCENRIVSAGYRNGASGFIALPPLTTAFVKQKVIDDSGDPAHVVTNQEIADAYNAYTANFYTPIFHNYAVNPKTAPALNKPLFYQILHDLGGQVDFITPNAGAWATTKIV